jgi:VanZ family protein
VIRPQEFFDFVSRFSGAGHESMQRLTVFWGLSWFAIVKGWHFTEFAVLTFLAAGTLKLWRGHATSWTVGGAMLFCVAFAASDEWHQTFIPDRFGTVQDVLIDSMGVCTAGLILLVWMKRRLAKCRIQSGDAAGVVS